MKHGASAYRHFGCRCEVCTAGSTERARTERAARAERLRLNPMLAPHGNVSTYKNWLCRCAPCTAAHAKSCADYQRRKAQAS